MIRTNAISALLLVAAIAPAGPVRADVGDGSWFVTAQYGQGDYDVTLKGHDTWWGDVDDDGDAFAVGLGYRPLPRLGLRVMYERVGGIGAGNRCSPDPRVLCLAISFEESTRAENWSLVAMPRLPLGDRWELYGTAGALRWSIEPSGIIADDSGTDFLYGAGLGYRLTGGWGLGVEYQASDTDYCALRFTAGFEF